MNKKLSFNETKYADWSLGFGDNSRIEKIVKWVGSDNVVLDIGCGIGEIGSQLKRQNNRVFGIDISPTAVKKANKRGITAKQCDIETQHIPFPNNRFDVVIAGEIIEHVFDTDAFLEKIHGVLKKKGRLILTTPNIATLGRRVMLVMGKNPMIEVNVTRHSAGHIRYFVKDSLLPLVESHGFKVELFESDVVNFSSDGRWSSTTLAGWFPTFGRTLIIRAVKI